MVKIVGAISLDRAIGVYDKKKGRLPWPASLANGDLDYFKSITEGTSIIMGRKTFQSMSKPLPKCNNIVISSRTISKEKSTRVKTCNRLKEAIESIGNNAIWLIGGHDIFEEGQRYASEIILTVIPYLAYEDHDISDLVYFPKIDTNKFSKRVVSQHPNNSRLRIIRYSSTT